MLTTWWRDPQPPCPLSVVKALTAKCLAVKALLFGRAGIKAIKLYAWEQPYIDRINQLREAELKMIRKAAFYQIFNTIMFGGGPILVSLASFGAFTFQGYSLTASVAFPALALFNLLRFPVMMFPNQIMNIIAAKVALDRIQNYMQVTIASTSLVSNILITADHSRPHMHWQCGEETDEGQSCLVLSTPDAAAITLFQLLVCPSCTYGVHRVCCPSQCCGPMLRPVRTEGFSVVQEAAFQVHIQQGVAASSLWPHLDHFWYHALYKHQSVCHSNRSIK